jgi:hypothetical protein
MAYSLRRCRMILSGERFCKNAFVGGFGYPPFTVHETRRAIASKSWSETQEREHSKEPQGCRKGSQCGGVSSKPVFAGSATDMRIARLKKIKGKTCEQGLANLIMQQREVMEMRIHRRQLENPSTVIAVRGTIDRESRTFGGNLCLRTLTSPWILNRR